MFSSSTELMVPTLVIVLSLGVLVPAQDTTYPIVMVNYRELRLVPESMLLLNESRPVFASEPVLVHLLSDNDTLFWEEIGHIGEAFHSNSSVSTYALVQINSTGFNEFLVGLSLDNATLQWMASLNSSITAGFATIVQAATDFFANDGHYWGLCEELAVLPGTLVGQSQSVVWRARFHLIAESERWTLLLDSSGHVLNTHFSTVPCSSCPDSTMIIVFGTIGVMTFALAVVLHRTLTSSRWTG